jgi:lipopolysaccharide export LptBFGC system permease protein LptF
MLLQALDRNDQNKRYDPLWIQGEAAGVTTITSQITLNISYEDLRVLSGMRQGTGTLNLWELFTAEKKFAGYGYAQKTLRAEILRRMGDALFFLPMSVLTLILGWGYRAQKKPRYVYVPMLVILPLVFYGVLFFYRNILNNLAIQLSINMGLSTAIFCLCAGAAVCFTISLILLAAQHG